MRKTIFRKLEAQGLIANYNHYRKNLPPKLPERVFIWDETLQEGTQTPTVFLTYVEKVKLAKMMDEMGVAFMTVGFPAYSEQEKNDIRRIANEGFQQMRLAALARTNKSDIDACLECGIKEILIFTPFNGLNLQYRLKATREEIAKRTVESIEYAKKHGATVNQLLSRRRLKNTYRRNPANIRSCSKSRRRQTDYCRYGWLLKTIVNALSPFTHKRRTFRKNQKRNSNLSPLPQRLRLSNSQHPSSS